MSFDVDYDVIQLPLTDKNSREQAKNFCIANGLDFDEKLDYYCGVFDGDKMVAGGGFDGNVIKCVAVDKEARSGGVTNILITRLRSVLNADGVTEIFVFTKTKNKEIFESLGFFVIATADDALLLSSSPRGIKRYCDGLAQIKTDGNNGAAVVNANPFTLGHRYLIRQAKKTCDRLYVFVVEENLSVFKFADRFELVKKGVADIEGVTVIPSGKYVISKTTFPTYFLKESGLIDKNCAQLDADIFGRYVAPALNIKRRYVGKEPTDVVTADYNVQLKKVLSKYGVDLVEFERFEVDGEAVSASTVRKCLDEKNFDKLKKITPQTTFEFLTKQNG